MMIEIPCREVAHAPSGALFIQQQRQMMLHALITREFPFTLDLRA